MKQKVRMLKTILGVDDGMIHPMTYVEGDEYEIGNSLLMNFIDLGVVDLKADKPKPGIPAESRETKVVEPEETKPDTLKLKKK